MLKSLSLKAGLLAALWLGMTITAHAAPTSTDVLNAYIQAWSEKSPEQRQKLLGKLVTDSVRYSDQFNQVKSRAALNEMIGTLHEQIPGLRGEIIGPVRFIDAAALFEWKVYNEAGEALFYGVDAVQFAEDGRLQRIDGFMNVGLK
ncbi:nuclear transport factor 2 family protein [Chitinibacter sp. FCG-7]|uniref:Nuclear transport factor 2 family protein n=1 Tax=Chitinibacter mangrovi TaxID=3153927 RepID=A0AAU7FEE1_9NEIS